MAIRNIDKIIKLGTHPLEDHFDVDKGSTEIVTTKRNTELEAYEPYDDKDKEIEQDYQMIMDSAMDLVDKLKEHIDNGAEAKFLSRLAEVASTNLGTALAAAEKKAKLKDSKDKFNFRKTTAPGNKTINHNNMTVVMTQSELLKTLFPSGDQNVIDVEATVVEENNQGNNNE